MGMRPRRSRPTFASYASVTIENARLYDAAQEQAYASAALLQVAQAVANSSSLDETINSVVRITPILVGVKPCASSFGSKGVSTNPRHMGYRQRHRRHFREAIFRLAISLFWSLCMKVDA